MFNVVEVKTGGSSNQRTWVLSDIHKCTSGGRFELIVFKFNGVIFGPKAPWLKINKRHLGVAPSFRPDDFGPKQRPLDPMAVV